MDKERALHLARKLAAINKGNATEAEAILAAEKLARIAAEHNLTRLDYTPEQVKQRVNSEKAEVDFDRRTNPPAYVNLLVGRLAQIFSAHCIWVGGNHLDIFGDETNVTLMKFFMEELLVSMPKLRWKAKCESGVQGNNPAWKRGWENGFIDAVTDRLKKIMSSMTEQQSINSRALVLVTKDLARQACLAKYPNMRKGKPTQSKPMDRSAYARGLNDGTRARLQANI